MVGLSVSQQPDCIIATDMCLARNEAISAVVVGDRINLYPDWLFCLPLTTFHGSRFHVETRLNRY